MRMTKTDALLAISATGPENDAQIGKRILRRPRLGYAIGALSKKSREPLRAR